LRYQKFQKCLIFKCFQKEFSFGNKRSVPLITSNARWRIVVPKRIFIIMCFNFVVVGKVLRQYFWELQIQYNGKISVSPRMLVQSSRKFQDIHNFACSIKLYKNYVKTVHCKTFGNCIGVMGPKLGKTSERQNSVKASLSFVKISGYMQFHSF
jgi:hypothetical protein